MGKLYVTICESSPLCSHAGNWEITEHKSASQRRLLSALCSQETDEEEEEKFEWIAVWLSRDVPAWVDLMM